MLNVVAPMNHRRRKKRRHFYQEILEDGAADFSAASLIPTAIIAASCDMAFISNRPFTSFSQFVEVRPVACTREYYRGKYHCTIDLLLYWFALVCFANKNKNCQLSYS
jgi:hypothetical protein